MSAAAFRTRMAIGAAITGFVLAILFLAFPVLDLAASGAFYRDGGFALDGPGPAEGVRQLFIWALWAFGIAGLVGLAIGAARQRRFLGLDFPAWLVLVVLLVVGPGLVANTLFKEEWGRPRPRDVIAYGGAEVFTPPLVRSDRCLRNCSFIGGEASSVFAVGFGLALVTRRRRAFLTAGIAGGLFVGLIRIGQGGHFLSDILYAGVFMALTAAFCHWLVFGLGNGTLADGSPFRHRLQRGCERIASRFRRRGDKSLLKD